MRKQACILLLAAALCGAAPKAPGRYFAWIGTYTGPDSKGIYALRFDPSTGAVDSPTLAGEIVNPSFLAFHPTLDVLYAVSELGNDGKTNGSVSAFSIDRKTGTLKLLNTVSSGGGGACHLVADRTGRMLIVANYGSGSTASFPIRHDGQLGEMASLQRHSGSSTDPRRQTGPHAHAVVLSPDNRFVFVPDLGLDQILAYKIDPASATLTPHDPPLAEVKKGSGPRHFAFHPSGKFAYALSEMGSLVTTFSYDAAAGRLTSIEATSTLPAGFDGTNNSAEIEIDARGRFLYASNRGHDSITVFAIDRGKGTLKTVQNISTGGSIPRNFKIDPTGRYLFAANQKTNNIVVFSVDSETGILTPTGKTVEVRAPVCILFSPAP
jgi:6-phosphogluconolactonase